MRFSVKRTDNDKDMIEEYQLRVLPETAANEQALRRYVAREKGKDERTLTAIRVLKRSIDARQRTIFVNLKLRVYVNEQPEDDEFVRTAYRNVEGRPQVVVVGAGPGGLFAALRLIEAGYRPVIVERGKNVRDRKLDWPKYRVNIKWTARAITVSGKAAQELIPTESCTPGARNAGMRRKS